MIMIPRIPINTRVKTIEAVFRKLNGTSEELVLKAGTTGTVVMEGAVPAVKWDDSEAELYNTSILGVTYTNVYCVRDCNLEAAEDVNE